MSSYKRGRKVLTSVVVIALLGVLPGLAAGEEPLPSGAVSDGTPAEYAAAEYLGTLEIETLAADAQQAGGEVPLMDSPELPAPASPDGSPNSVVKPPQPLVPGPDPLHSFQGSAYSGWIPPDTQGAVGPDHLMAVTNGSVRIQERDGTVLSTVTLDAFFGGLGVTASTFDPRVLYDHHADQWLLIATANARSLDSAILVAASATSDPTGTWFGYLIDADDRTELGVAAWADYPNVGYNDNWVVITANMYTTGAASTFERPKAWIFPRTDLYNGGALDFGFWGALDPSVHGGTMVPAVTHDTGVTTLYLLTTWNGNSGGNGYMKLYEITGPVDAAVISDGQFISTSSTWGQGGTNFAPQTGSAETIHVGDDRVLNMVYRSGFLFAAHTIFLPAASPTRSAVQIWSGINPGNLTTAICQIDDPTATIFRGFPSVDVNADGDMLVGYSRFTAGSHPSAAYSFHDSTDLSCQFRDEVVFKAGESTYVDKDGSGRNRWGDYSATVVDPVNDLDLWTIQEYSASPANTWGTWWAMLRMAAPDNDDFAARTVISAPVQALGTNVNATTEPAEVLGCADPDVGGTSPFGATVWYQIQGTGADLVIDTVGSSFDTVLSVYRGSTLSPTFVACDDDTPGVGTTSRVEFTAAAGESYFVQVGGYDPAEPATGSVVLNVAAEVPPAPANDLFADAQPTSLPTVLTSSNLGAGVEPSEPLSCFDMDVGSPSPFGATVWYGATAAADGEVAVDTFGSDFDTVIGVYTGSDLALLTEIACDDDDEGEAPDSSLTFTATAGTTYWVQVGGYEGAGGPEMGDFVLKMTASGADMEVPTWPPGAALTATQIGETNIALSWDAATDNVGVVIYKVFVDGAFWGSTTSGTTMDVVGLIPGTTYDFHVEAMDASGNESSDGPALTETTAGKVVSVPPWWPAGSTISAPDIFDDEVTIEWSAAEDDVAVVAYAVYMDHLLVGTTTERLFTMEGLDEKTRYHFSVEAGDGDGNWTSGEGPGMFVTTGPEFIDTIGHIFDRDIAWLAGAGITRGCNPPVNDMFCPDGVVTRGQMAAFLTRALGLTDRLVDPFSDDDGSIFEADIERLAAAGITRGCNPPVNDMFCPDGVVTRGQMAAFLRRALSG